MTAWYRAFSETLNDPKVQTLPLDAFKAWHNCLYLASSISSATGNIGTIEQIAFAFRETVSSVSSAFHPLLERGLLVTENETFHIVSWRKRQYKSDTSTERVKRFRKRSRNVTETAPDTDTDTDIPLAKASDAGASSDKEFWDNAKAYLGKSKASMIGKWCRDHGQAETAKAITASQIDRAVDPVPYIERVLRGKANGIGPRGIGI